MIPSPTPLVVAYLISSVISALIAWYCWQRHEVNGAREYAVVGLSQSLWTMGLILELISPNLDGKIFWDNAQFVTTASWLLAFLAFTLRYTERRLPRPRTTLALLGVPLVALVVLAYTDPLHGLIRAHARLVSGQSYNALLYEAMACGSASERITRSQSAFNLGLIDVPDLHNEEIKRDIRCGAIR